MILDELIDFDRRTYTMENYLLCLQNLVVWHFDYTFFNTWDQFFSRTLFNVVSC
jgi:hypothetical protein